MSAYQGSGPTAAPTVRAPRAQVLLNGQVMPGLVSASVHLKNNFEAAEFTIDANIEPSYPTNSAWWSVQTKVVASHPGRLPDGRIGRLADDGDGRRR